MPGPRREPHKIVIKGPAERTVQDLDTRDLQELPQELSLQALLKHGICKLLMQGPLREDLTRIPVFVDFV